LVPVWLTRSLAQTQVPVCAMVGPPGSLRMLCLLLLGVPCLASTSEFDRLIEENNMRLQEAREACNQEQVSYFERRGHEIVENENNRFRQERARKEAFLQEQRDVGDRMRADSERRKQLYHQQEMLKWQTNAAIVNWHLR